MPPSSKNACGDNPDHLERLLLAANVQRKKTLQQQLREFEYFLQLESKAAKSRQGERTDIGETLPGGDKGRAREIAAKRVGLSGRSAERGLEVVQTLAQREETGNALPHDGIRRLLNKKGVEPTYKRAVDLGWIHKATIPSKLAPPASKAAESAVQLTVVDPDDTETAAPIGSDLMAPPHPNQDGRRKAVKPTSPLSR